jgi:hypothetical protein
MRYDGGCIQLQADEAGTQVLIMAGGRFSSARVLLFSFLTSCDRVAGCRACEEADIYKRAWLWLPQAGEPINEPICARGYVTRHQNKKKPFFA